VTSRSRLASAVRQLLGTLAAAIARVVGGSGASSAGRSQGGRGFVGELTLAPARAWETPAQRRRLRPLTRLASTQRRVRRLGRALVLGSAAAGAWLALASAPASAAIHYVQVGQFGSSGTGDGQFAPFAAQGAAIDASGDFYVADGGNARIEKFSSDGTFVAAWGWGVSNGSATSEVCTSGCQAGIAGSGNGQFSSSLFAVAVDNSTDPTDTSAGDVYVADNGNDRIEKFSSSGTWLANITAGSGGAFSSVQGVATDASGNVWVDEGGGSVDEFDNTAANAPLQSWSTGFGTGRGIAVDSSDNVYVAHFNDCLEKFTGAGTDLGNLNNLWVTHPAQGCLVQSSAVDPATQDLFVGQANVVSKYDASSLPATLLTDFGAQNQSSAQGVAVAAATGDVYVVDQNNAVVYVFAPVTVPDVTTGSASNVQGASATLNGTVNPDGIQLTDCHFEYGTDTSYGSSAPCVPAAASIPPDSNVHAVSADITGLEPNTTYHFRLDAANANGSNQGSDQTFTTLPTPLIDGASVTNLSATSADLNARIDPDGLDTTYHLEYGTSTSYGTSVPIPDADIGSGSSDVAVTQHLSGLSANTTYHWRVIATNADGTTTSPDHTFAYLTSGGGLPDGRAYEMVTPASKGGGFVDNVMISTDGSRLYGLSTGSFANTGNDVVGAPYEFARTASGWSTTALNPPAAQFVPGWDVQGTYASADGPDALFLMATTANPDVANLYLRRADGSFPEIGPITPPSAGANWFGEAHPELVLGASRDLSTVVFTLNRVNVDSPGCGLWPFDATDTSICGSLYEYSGTGNSTPVLVGVSGGAGSTALIGSCGVELGGDSSERYNAVSADGATVFFTPNPSWVCGGSGPPVYELFARIDASRTVAISEPSPNDECTTSACTSAPLAGAHFDGASADGSRAFFTSTRQLTDQASEDSTQTDGAVASSNVGTPTNGCPATTGPNGCNLYLYDLGAPTGHNLVAVSVGDSSGLGPQVQGVVRVSEDGSHVYFFARGVLASGATAGADNLYAYERDAQFPAGRTGFIAELCSGPGRSGAAADAQCPAGLNSVAPGHGYSHNDTNLWRNESCSSCDPFLTYFGRPAQATPDGRFLVFSSFARLTPDDSSGARQVFRYDSQTGTLVRVSVGEQGYNDNGNAGSGDASIPAPDYGSGGGFDLSVGGVVPQRTMSDNGSYVFFQSPAALTPQALDDVRIGTDVGCGSGVTCNGNGNPVYAQNVYEYHDGHVYLISDGRDSSPSTRAALLGTDASGANVFFQTADQLVPQDTDTQLDIYDAHICTTATPCIKPPPPSTPPCQGDACKGPLSGAPPAPTAASVSFSGPGNVSGPGNASPGTAPARVRVLSRVVHGSTFFLRVKVPARGRITITGAGIRNVHRFVARAGTYKLRVMLTAKEKKLLRHKRRLKLRLHVSYAPPGGAASSVTFSITDKA
jgi:hypothetical protein